MPLVPFAQLPDHARVWTFGSAQPIPSPEVESLLSGVDDFVASWTAHGQPVIGGFDWRFDHFLVVAADERASGVSGCSIDSLFRTLKEIEQEIGHTLLDSSLVWFRDPSGGVRAVQRREFRRMVEQGEVGEETIVFDNTAPTLGAIRGGEWERPLRESWHGQAFLARR